MLSSCVAAALGRIADSKEKPTSVPAPRSSRDAGGSPVLAKRAGSASRKLFGEGGRPVAPKDCTELRVPRVTPGLALLDSAARCRVPCKNTGVAGTGLLGLLLMNTHTAKQLITISKSKVTHTETCVGVRASWLSASRWNKCVK